MFLSEIKEKSRGLVAEKRVPGIINIVEVETKNKEDKKGYENGHESQEIGYIWRHHILISYINRRAENLRRYKYETLLTKGISEGKVICYWLHIRVSKL